MFVPDRPLWSRHFAALGMLLVSSASAAQPRDFDAHEEARTFLLRYIGLTATSDVVALNMYRDDARIRVGKFSGSHEVKAGIVTGKDWIRQLRAGWFDGTSKLEVTRFQNASVTQQGRRLVIRASRYSQTRCYWDNDYAVAIEPDAHGQFQIVEERISFQQDAYCPSTAPPTGPAPTATWQSPQPAASPGRPARLPPNIVPIGQGSAGPATASFTGAAARKP